MEDVSIFDKEFEASIKIRRRSLLSVWLRIYMFAGMLGGVMMLVLMILIFVFPDKEMTYDGYSVAGRTLAFIFCVGITSLYFLRFLLLLLEVKSAIRWNWVTAAVWNVFFGIIMIVLYSPITLAICLISVPYWIMLYKIQYKWEKVAVSGRSLKK